MAYAKALDVRIELGRPPLSSTEQSQWEAWLNRVERSIERAFRRASLVLADQVALGDPTRLDVIDVEVAAVIRKIHLPQFGRTSTTRSVDDTSVTDRWETESDGLGITDDEWSSLLPGSAEQACSTRPGFTPDNRLTFLP